jgi:hypothetical protein
MSEEDDKNDNASNDDTESKKDKSKKDKSKKDESKKHESKDRSAPHWGMKALRVFLFATLGTFLAAYLFGDSIPNGLRVDFDLIASIKLGLIAGVLAALLRALAAMLPLFADD